jgi:hypothetical protein
MIRILLITLVALAFSALGAVCLHSLEEIHYLKSFFPRSFSVQEAASAALVEMVKVHIIALPLVVLIAICLFFYDRTKKR